MADRGFKVVVDLALWGAHLSLHAFMKINSQLSRDDLEKKPQLARVCIHVQQVSDQV